MSLTDRLGAIKQWLAERERERALSTFTCGNCEQNAHCGRPPSADCVEKHAHVAQEMQGQPRQGGSALKLPYS